MLFSLRSYKLIIFLLWLIGACSPVAAQHRRGKKVQSNKEPKFIEDIYLDGHVLTKATVNAIDSRKKNVKSIQNKVLDTNITPSQVVIAPVSKDTINAIDTKINTVIDLSSGTLLYDKYAKILGVSSGELSNFNLYKFVDKWYGTNYRLGGFSEQGVDCSGFTKLLYQEVYGIELTRTSVEQHKNANREKSHNNAKEGDLVFFRQRSKRINHVGVYLGNSFFIHASTSHGVMISSLTETHWSKSFAGIGKIGNKSGE